MAHGHGGDIITHPDAQLHIFSPVHLHSLIQQANLLKVQPIHHEAANQGRAPGGIKDDEDQFCLSVAVLCTGNVSLAQLLWW